MILFSTWAGEATEMDSIDRRKEARSPTRDTVAFEVGGQSFDATMRNLSQAGCMIECSEAEAEIGQFCEVMLQPEFPASGRIAWQLGGALGIAFHQPVPIGIVRNYALDDWMFRRMANS